LEAMAARYGQRPSSFLGLDGWEAYCLDEALYYQYLKRQAERPRSRGRK